jgi:enamine deaminase RidA (YjgF/YER057c/UK114 family)
VVRGDECWVAGTTDAGPDGHSANPGDPAAQARAALATIEAALGEAGFTLEDVVRTRLYVAGRAAIEPVLEVHGAVFATIRPAATLVVVAGLIDPSLLVEIEVDAARS